MPRRDDVILPGLDVDAGPWTEVAFQDLAGTTLAPHQLITGFGAIRDFNLLEDRVCEQFISPETQYARRAHGQGGISGAVIAKSRLADEIRPPGVHSLQNAAALVFPFNPARAREYRGEVYVPEDLEPKDGLTFLLVGTTHSSAPHKRRMLAVEATYFDIGRNAAYVDRIRRIVAGRKILAELAEASLASNLASAERVYKVAQYAVSHVYRYRKTDS